MAHESFKPHHEESVKTSSDRSFGLVFCAVFVLAAFAPLFKHGEIRIWALILAGVFGGLALALPTVLAPLNRLWTKLGLLLHKIVNPIVLGLMFFVSIVPIGLILKLTGKDLLKLKFDPLARSYWIVREPAGPDPKSLNRQF